MYRESSAFEKQIRQSSRARGSFSYSLIVLSKCSRRLILPLLSQVKPTEVSSLDLDVMCQTIQDKFFHMASPPRSILNDLEGCIGRADCSGAETVAEISLSNEMIVTIARWLGNEERVQTLVSANRDSRGAFGEQLSEQLLRDGMVQ